MKFTKKQKAAFFKEGHVPANKRIFTPEEEQYIKDNYAKVTKVEMAEKLKLNPHTILRIMTRMGLKRTQEEIDFVLSKKRKRDSNWTMAVRKIEGGGRGNPRANYHLTKWIKTNGEFSSKKVLVYKNAKFDDFNDLVLINKRGFASFMEKRPKRILWNTTKEEREKKKELKREFLRKKEADLQKKAIVKAVVKSQTLKKKHEKEEAEKRFEAIKASRPKTPEEAHNQLVSEGKVPVKLDHKTTIWVLKSKCEFVDGAWVKKTPLNIVAQKEKDNLKLIIKKPKRNEESNNELLELIKADGESDECISQELDGSTSN